MKYLKAVASVATGIALVATALTGVVAPAHAAVAYKLVVSKHANRSHAVSLNGATLGGKVYIFATPATKNILRVKFYLDGKLVHTETTAPYDFMGGVGDTLRPASYNTAQLRNGRHSIHIAVDLQNKQHASYTAKFTVKNVPPRPAIRRLTVGHAKVTVSWISGGGSTAGFNVYRGTTSHVSLRHRLNAKVMKKSARQFVDTTVTPGHRYYYVVQAVSSTHARSTSKPKRSGRVLRSDLAVVTAKAMGGDGAVTVAWSNHGTADHVRIFRTTSMTFPATPIKTLAYPPTTKKLWVDRSVTNGTLYRYKVELVAGTHRVHSAALTATPIAAPSVTLAGVSNGIKLSWNGGGAGVTSYAIYRSTSIPVPLTGPLTVVPAGTSTFTDTTTTPGTTYSYAVQARGLHGHAQTTVTATPPAAPVLHLPASSHNSVTLTWSAPASGAASVTEYDVFRGTSGADAITHTPHKQPPSDLNWVDTTVSDDTTYFYVVRAISNGGTADSGAQQATPLGAPANLHIALDGSNQPVLTWDVDSNTPATRYRIFGGTSSTVSLSSELDHVFTPASTYTDNSATNAHTYYYVVQAWYSNGTGSGSANSSTVSISTPQNAATNVTAVLGLDGVDVSWDPVDDSATSVEVYRSDSDQTLGDLISGSLPQSATEYTDTDNLHSEDTVFYTVRVLGPGGHTDSAPVEYDVP